MGKNSIILSIIFLLAACEKSNNSSYTSEECNNWSASCTTFHEIEQSFEDAWKKNDKENLLIMINSMRNDFDSDDIFYAKFQAIVGQTGVLPGGSFELCKDSCWIKTISKERKKQYENMIIGVYNEYVKNGRYYPVDTAFHYCVSINTQHRSSLDSGLFTPRQYLDTLDFYIKNRVEVDLGG